MYSREKTKKMNIILCANHRAGYEAIFTLLSSDFVSESSLLVFTHNNDESKAIVDECKKLGIKHFCANINDCNSLVTSFKPDIILSCYYRFIIKEDILSSASIGCLNIHPSLLPYYKGTFSTPWAIINGEKQTGISIHEMVKSVDTGKIILQTPLNIRPNDTAYSLYHRLVTLAIKMLPCALKDFAQGYKGQIQDPPTDTSKLYFSRKLPFGGILNVDQTTYSQGCDFIRAMYFPPHQGAQFRLRDGSLLEAKTESDISSIADQFYERSTPL